MPLKTKSYNVREKGYENKEVKEKHLILKLNGKYPHRFMTDFSVLKKSMYFLVLWTRNSDNLVTVNILRAQITASK